MASQNNLTAVFTDIANAIRDKKGSVDTIKPINMADEILTISSGVSVKDFITTRNAKNLFYSCGSLTSEQLASILKYDDTSGANNMIGMFLNCSSLTTIPLLNTSKVRDMREMFRNCGNLIVIPPFDTSSCSDMYNMFRSCSKLEKIDITKFVGETSYNNYFAQNCHSLKTLIIRTMDTIPSLNSNAFQNCYHFYGTTDATYNPNGLKDGRIYVPDDKVESLKTTTNWSVFADIIKPLSEYVE